MLVLHGMNDSSIPRLERHIFTTGGAGQWFNRWCLVDEGTEHPLTRLHADAENRVTNTPGVSYPIFPLRSLDAALDAAEEAAADPGAWGVVSVPKTKRLRENSYVHYLFALWFACKIPENVENILIAYPNDKTGTRAVFDVLRSARPAILLDSANMFKHEQPLMPASHIAFDQYNNLSYKGPRNDRVTAYLNMLRYIRVCQRTNFVSKLSLSSGEFDSALNSILTDVFGCGLIEEPPACDAEMMELYRISGLNHVSAWDAAEDEENVSDRLLEQEANLVMWKDVISLWDYELRGHRDVLLNLRGTSESVAAGIEQLRDISKRSGIAHKVSALLQGVPVQDLV